VVVGVGHGDKGSENDVMDRAIDSVAFYTSICTTYTSERASKSTIPSDRSAMVSGGFPVKVSNVPMNSTMAS